MKIIIFENNVKMFVNNLKDFVQSKYLFPKKKKKNRNNVFLVVLFLFNRI